MSFILSMLLVSCAPVPVDLALPTDGSDGSDGGAQVVSGVGGLEGRVCASGGQYWLEGASVYVHVMEDGSVVDTRQATTDAGGWWALSELPVDQVYDVFIQLGNERLWDQETYGVEVVEDQLTRLDEPDCDVLDPLTTLVVQGDYDDAEGLVLPFGFPTDHVDGQDHDQLAAVLSDLDLRSSYDLIIVESGITEDGVLRGTGDVPAQVIAGVQAFVEAGGVLLVTDWSYDLVLRAFPGYLSFVGDDDTADSAQTGVAGQVSAVVADPGLAADSGMDSIDLAFSRPGWAVVTGHDTGVSPLLLGAVDYREDGVAGSISLAPLLLRFPRGRGTVVFSAFSLEENDDAQGLALFRALFADI